MSIEKNTAFLRGDYQNLTFIISVLGLLKIVFKKYLFCFSRILPKVNNISLLKNSGRTAKL